MKHILIVDDNKEFLEEIHEALSMKGYRVTGISNELTALQKITESKPDLLLLDVKMREKTGLQIAIELSGRPAIAHIPIIIMTGYYSENEVKRFMTLGIIKDWILKPIHLDELIKKIEALP